jgi:hypothetical protein
MVCIPVVMFRQTEPFAKGFCQGECARGESLRPERRMVCLKSSLKIWSLSRMTYLVESSKRMFPEVLNAQWEFAWK